MEYLTFALAKGRLADITMDLLEKMGITCDEMKESSRKLIFTNEELKLNAGMLVLFDTFPNSSGSSGKEGVSV